MAATHVIDRDGNVWRLLPEYDGGMVARGTALGVMSAGIAWLERNAGPLVEFDPDKYRRKHLARGE